MIQRPWSAGAARHFAVATIFLLGVGSEAWAGGAEKHEAWNWSGAIATGRTLEVNGVNGTITAERSAGNSIEIVADKHGRRSDPATVRIKVVQDSDGITVCAVYPSSGSPCESGLHFGSLHRNDVQVDFRIKVPANVTFAANTVNGEIRARSLAGPVRAHTVNGSCDIETSQGAEAETVNGSVRAVLGRVGSSEHLKFNTVNGNITLLLPEGLGAEVQGATVNGSIQADFPVNVSGKWGGRSMRATIGRGGARLDANTVNGSIQLKRSL